MSLEIDYRRRALLLWPRLDSTRLTRTGGNPWRIAYLVARRTALPLETILAMLTGLPAGAFGQPIGAAGRSGASR